MEELPSTSDTTASHVSRALRRTLTCGGKSERKCGEQLQGKKFSHMLKVMEMRQCFLKIKDLLIRSIPLIKQAEFQNNSFQ